MWHRSRRRGRWCGVGRCGEARDLVATRIHALLVGNVVTVLQVVRGIPVGRWLSKLGLRPPAALLIVSLKYIERLVRRRHDRNSRPGGRFHAGCGQTHCDQAKHTDRIAHVHTLVLLVGRRRRGLRGARIRCRGLGIIRVRGRGLLSARIRRRRIRARRIWGRCRRLRGLRRWRLVILRRRARLRGRRCRLVSSDLRIAGGHRLPGHAALRHAGIIPGRIVAPVPVLLRGRTGHWRRHYRRGHRVGIRIRIYRGRVQIPVAADDPPPL